MNEPAKVLTRALEQLATGRYGSARALCRKVLHRLPDHFDARHLLGVICLREGDAGRAVRELEAAITLKAPPRQKAQALSNLALALSATGQAGEALARIEEALSLEPDEPAFLANRLGFLEQLGQWPELLDSAQALLRRDPGDEQAEAALLLAARQLGRIEEVRNPGTASDAHLPELVAERLLLAALTGGPEAASDQAASIQAPELLEFCADYAAEQGEEDLALNLYRLLVRQRPNDESLAYRLDALAGVQRRSAPQGYVESLYDAHADAFEARLVGRLHYRAPWLAAEKVAQLRPSLELVADLGCGTGLAGAQLRSLCSVGHLAGVDLSAAMLAQAGRKGVYDSLEQADAVRWLEESDIPLSLILALDMLIYLGELEPLFAAVAGRLSPNGLFVFTTEQSTGEEIHLQRNGRFQHHDRYIQRLAAANGLRTESREGIPLRLERGEVQPGRLWILRRAQ